MASFCDLSEEGGHIKNSLFFAEQHPASQDSAIGPLGHNLKPGEMSFGTQS